MSERSAVQNPMLKYANEIGWEYVPRQQALQHRGGDTGLYFNDILQTQLIKLNTGIVTTDRAAEILRRLNLLKPNIEGNREALAWMRGEKSIFVTEENRDRNVKLIDFDNPANNIFQVTDEWRHKSVAFANRADVVFLINGIPVTVAETKKAGKPDGLAEGVDQLRRYHRETPEIFTAAQIFEVTQLFDFYYGLTWATNRKNIFNWKDEQPESINYERKVKDFFNRDRFLNVLKNYILFLTKDDILTKVILRQHQTRAIEKVCDRVQDPHKRRGLVWHTQGSGKTLTMITIAALLLRGNTTEKPTILMLVDRNELEGQLTKNIAAYGITNYKIANSKRDLRDIFASDYRGLVVSMIHKFDDIPANLNTRSSITVLVDEAHRTTGGNLGNYLMGALPNATYIGFTGTPIDKLSQGEGTFKVFGTDDPQGYLDKYSIKESIEDGTTVKLNYALASSELRIDRETLEREFLDLSTSEGVSDIEELNAILDNAIALKELLKSDKRIDKIAAAVAQHFTENVEPMGFKAFLVAVDREACMLYKQALDKYLPAEYSHVVYSPSPKDSPEMKAYYLTEEQEKQLRKDFIDKTKQPKILIVTEKLLTGFDAPILYSLYLDKPMRDHVLLQAIARVNRPYEDESGQVKPYGFVLDFVGIFEKLSEALAFDKDEIASAIQNIDVLKALFDVYIKDNAQAYLALTKGWDDKAKEQAVEYFNDKDVREKFFKFFKQLQNLYDILSPDAFLRPYIEDYQALAELYATVRSAYNTNPYIDRELTSKTKELLRQHTDITHLELPNEIKNISAIELEALKASNSSDVIKVLNLRKLLAVTVQTEGESKPFLLSIGDRADKVNEAYENRQLTTQEALAEYEKLTREAAEAAEQREKLNIDENTFAIYITLRLVTENLSVNQAQEINMLFLKFPDYSWHDASKAQLRTELYKALRPIVGADKMISTTDTLLKLKRI